MGNTYRLTFLGSMWLLPFLVNKLTMTEYQLQVNHLAELSKLAGMREHIIARLKELEKEPGFAGITQEVFSKVRADKAAA